MHDQRYAPLRYVWFQTDAWLVNPFFFSLGLYFFYAIAKVYRRMINGLREELSMVCTLFKLINNSLNLNKGNHDRDVVWISDLYWRRFLRFYFSVFSLVLVSIEKTVSSAIQTPRISLKILRCASYFQLYSRCLDTPMKHSLSLVFDILLCKLIKNSLSLNKGNHDRDGVWISNLY